MKIYSTYKGHFSSQVNTRFSTLLKKRLSKLPYVWSTTLSARDAEKTLVIEEQMYTLLINFTFTVKKSPCM